MMESSGCGEHHEGGGHSCCTGQSGGSVQQTLSEMDFERGIWTAALDGEEERVEKMLSQGTDPNAVDTSGYTALHYAARSGHLEVCRALVNRGAKVDMRTRSGGASPLHRASYRGHLPVVTYLLDRGADPKLQDSDGQTSLHRAAAGGKIPVIKYLISKNQDLLSITDKRGRSPIDCYEGTDDSIKTLLQ